VLTTSFVASPSSGHYVAAATINFFLPRLSSQNPVRDKLVEASLTGGRVQSGIQEMVAEYDKKFGLDKPLWSSTSRILRDVSWLDFNYSIANYPRTVTGLILEALPWTIGCCRSRRCSPSCSGRCSARSPAGRARRRS
jgi:ABC-type dipeptide/oligopeptide/nickel transport system permease component